MDAKATATSSTARVPSQAALETADPTQLRELVVCSLEPWDDVWRRNQFLVDALLRRNPKLRVLFVEPPCDPLFNLRSLRRPQLPRWRRVSLDGRLRAFRPLKPLPRRVGRLADEALLRQVSLAVKQADFFQPTLWINDVTYARLIQRTGWPSLYDVTDDWLLAPNASRELRRLQHLDGLALADADEVVVCSDALAASRGERRSVTLVPNAVDVNHFRRPRARPIDLPSAPTAVYLGTLHEARVDVDLVLRLAAGIPRLNIVLVGPNALHKDSERALERATNVFLLGKRPYDDAPAYLQHADIVIVPHRVSAFSETLDPIKAYECLAIQRPTVATPVAGFRELEGNLVIAVPDEFVARVETVLGQPHVISQAEPVQWEDRAAGFEDVLQRAVATRNARR